MKISQAVLCILGVTNGKTNLAGGKSAVAHKHAGWFQNSISHRAKRDAGRQAFEPLAAMVMYMRGFDADNKDPRSHSDFQTELDDLADTYANYGCYCWIDGVDAGVIGGGQTHDNTDHHCKELYRCYKCVKNDYSKSYTDVSYIVDFTTGSNGRELDCTINGKQDSENICECDKRFAEGIAETEQLCLNSPQGSDDNGPFCMDESFRTTSGTVPGTTNTGTFDAHQTCTDGHLSHGSGSAAKEECCGIYPNRYPYDEGFEECCRQTGFNQDSSTTDIFTLFEIGQCTADNGVVVKNVEGDPHTYHAV